MTRRTGIAGPRAWIVCLALVPAAAAGATASGAAIKAIPYLHLWVIRSDLLRHHVGAGERTDLGVDAIPSGLIDNGLADALQDPLLLGVG
jgi:hypothetical protein